MIDEYNNMKEQLLTNISTGLDDFLESYINEMKKKEVENKKLDLALNQGEMKKWKIAYDNEKEKNEFLLSMISCYQYLYLNEKRDRVVKHALMKLLETSFEKNDELLISLVLKTYLMTPALPTYFDEKNINDFGRILLEILKTPFNSKREEIYLYSLKILNIFGQNTSLRKELIVLLPNSHQRIEANIYECFDLNLLIDFLRLCILYNLNGKEIYEDVIIDWEFWGEKIDYQLFSTLLWYGVIFQVDKKLLEAVTNSAEYLSLNKTEVQLYKDINDINSYNKQLNKRINNLTQFTMLERQKIIETFDKKMNLEKPVADKILKSATQPKEVPNVAKPLRKLAKVFKIDLVNVLDHINRNELKKEQVELAVYPNAYVNEPARYIKVNVYSINGKGPVYVDEEQIIEIRKLSSPHCVVVQDQIKNDKGNKTIITPTTQTNKGTDFIWPTTEVKQTSQSGNEDVQLNDKSDLRKLGYQITGVSRSKRWDILQKAVGQLGLRKVAYTIASNVRLRKGQKNGLNKFSFSISEWEYDLKRLKEKYYKHNFTWPST